MFKTYKGQITKLKENEVFVFTSNRDYGFHGAGSAGFASFGESGNVWRKHNYDKWPNGTQGKWNVKGVAYGFQEGKEGKSFAIPTVTRAGAKKSLSLVDIGRYIDDFHGFVLDNPNFIFYIAQGINQGLSGWSPHDMALAWSRTDWPDNVYFEEEFAKLLS